MICTCEECVARVHVTKRACGEGAKIRASSLSEGGMGRQGLCVCVLGRHWT